MQTEEIVINLVLLVFATFGWLAARFYLRVTDRIKSGLLLKLRKPVSISKILIPSLILLAAVLAHYRNVQWLIYSAEITLAALFVVLTATTLLLASILAVYLNTSTRKQVKATTEAQIFRYLIAATLYVVTALMATVLFCVRAAANSRSGRHTSGDPWGYHGYESYEDKARRINGGPY